MPATLDEMHAIAERSLALFEWYMHTNEVEDDDDLRGRALEVAREVSAAGLRFAAALAAANGSPELIPLVHSMTEPLLRASEYYDDGLSDVDRAIKSTLANAEVDAAVRALAQHHAPRFRVAAATGISPDTPAGLALLLVLARDAEPSVRKAARDKLGPERAPAWWSGLFDGEPIARLPRRGRARAEQAVKRVAELGDERWPKAEQIAEMVKELGFLPPPLVFEASRRLLGVDQSHQLRYRVGLLSCFLRQPAAGAPLLALLKAYGDRDDHYWLKEAVAAASGALPRARRHAMAVHLAMSVAELPPEAVTGGWPALVTEVAATLLPPSSDPTPLLEALLPILRAGDPSYNAYTLFNRIEGAGAEHKRVTSRIVELALGDDLAGWRLFSPRHETLLNRASIATRRAAAQRFLTSDEPSRVKWALAQLLGPCHDARRDGPRFAIVARCFADDRLRPNLDHTLAISFRRQRMRAGQATFDEALATLKAIDALWGGFGSVADDAARIEKAARRGLGDVLGPTSLRGPITSEEWSIYRELRATSSLSDRELSLALMCIPGGPRIPSDDAVVALAIERSKVERMYVLWTAWAIQASPTPGDVERLDAILPFAERTYGRSQVLEARDVVVAALGIAAQPEAAPPPPGGDDDEDDWDDDD